MDRPQLRRKRKHWCSGVSAVDQAGEARGLCHHQVRQGPDQGEGPSCGDNMSTYPIHKSSVLG